MECGADCERVLSAPAVHFKGSGFYTTDYARKGRQEGRKRRRLVPSEKASPSSDSDGLVEEAPAEKSSSSGSSSGSTRLVSPA